MHTSITTQVKYSRNRQIKQGSEVLEFPQFYPHPPDTAQLFINNFQKNAKNIRNLFSF